MRDVPTPHEVLLSQENHQQNAFIPQATLIPLTQIDLRATDWEELGESQGWFLEEETYYHAGRLFLQSLFPTSRSVQGRGSNQIVMTAPTYAGQGGSLDGVGMAPDLKPPEVAPVRNVARQALPVAVNGIKKTPRLFGWRNGRS